MQDSLAAAVVKHLASMATTQLIAARATPDTMAHFRALANRQRLTESALLKRRIALTIQSVSGDGGEGACMLVSRSPWIEASEPSHL